MSLKINQDHLLDDIVLGVCSPGWDQGRVDIAKTSRPTLSQVGRTTLAGFSISSALLRPPVLVHARGAWLLVCICARSDFVRSGVSREPIGLACPLGFAMARAWAMEPGRTKPAHAVVSSGHMARDHDCSTLEALVSPRKIVDALCLRFQAKSAAPCAQAAAHFDSNRLRAGGG